MLVVGWDSFDCLNNGRGVVVVGSGGVGGYCVWVSEVLLSLRSLQRRSYVEESLFLGALLNLRDPAVSPALLLLRLRAMGARCRDAISFRVNLVCSAKTTGRANQLPRHKAAVPTSVRPVACTGYDANPSRPGW